ncbi:antibiotic biosynthesis monooxygenase family protein [Celeribacter sp. SCSIO 80788]|jgi:heme-degrading monooxygenase HmoA|uniref:antibiotic biosynthesis monooxygenase family protein n=1 Tax=Celeribacter sp. SCSIO 80788 TaxID=3117013 RepID=UPI003DA67DDD
MLKPLSLCLACLACSASADVTLINVFEVPEGQRDSAIASWEAARDFLAGQPGYISTSLQASLAPDARFALINIAKWDTPEAFAEATRKMQAANIFPPVEGLRFTPALYSEIRAD